MTSRERKLRKVGRLNEWADKREEKATANHNAATSIAEMIPFGQPILVGHHSEGRHRRDIGRIDTNMRNSIENGKKADSMRSRAAGIEHQLANTIFSDDEDAIEKMEQKIATLENERESIKAFNLSCRKGEPDKYLAPLTRRNDVGSQYMSKDGQFPSYVLSNLNANINRYKKRLAKLKR